MHASCKGVMALGPHPNPTLCVIFFNALVAKLNPPRASLGSRRPRS